MVTDNLSHLCFSVGKGCNTGDQLSVSACHLLAIGQAPRTGYISGINSIADDDVQAFLCRSGSETPEDFASMSAWKLPRGNYAVETSSQRPKHGMIVRISTGFKKTYIV
jgi:hypothetical protein